MSNTHQDMWRGSGKHSAGVNGLGHPKEIYIPSLHNPPAPMRTGAQDAISYPSRDASGNCRPYWAATK